MKIFFTLCIFLFINDYCWAQPKGIQTLFEQAKEAYSSHDYETFRSKLFEANTLHPYHQTILYQLGIACALTNQPEESIHYLQRAIQIDARYKLDIPDLNSLIGRKDYAELRSLQIQLREPIIQSDTAFVLKDRTLHIECLDLDPGSKQFYLGSIYQNKIIKVDSGGNVSDFISSGYEGMTSVFGVKVDKRRNVLWVCSSPTLQMKTKTSSDRSYVFQFDLKDGRLLKKYAPEGSYTEHSFGDLCLTARGDVYVSDSKNNLIYRVNENSETLELFYESEEFWNIQGLTTTDNGQYLYISDYIKGLYRLNLMDKKLVKLSFPWDHDIKGVDGLTFYKNRLIAIQNGIQPNQVVHYFLSPSGIDITKYKIYDRDHPAFNEPTNGCLDGNQFYYVATSQWSGYENNVQKPVSELQDIVILKSHLQPVKREH